jgi:tetratricopeptide (TPR) repeat protein
MINSIIEITDNPEIDFSYKAVRGVHLLGLSEFPDAERQLKSCLEQLRSANLPCLSTFAENKLAGVLNVLALLRLRVERKDILGIRYLEEARYFYNKMLRESSFTPLGEAPIYAEIAATYCFQADWTTARGYYDRAIAACTKAPLYKILSAKCDIQIGDLDEARQKLNNIEIVELDRTAYVDYAFQCAALAIESRSNEDVALAKQHLDKSDPRWPYFREERDSYKIALLSQKGSSEAAESGYRIGILSGLLKYVNISPGLFGVSIDLNKIIEDFIAKRGHDATS